MEITINLMDLLVVILIVLAAVLLVFLTVAISNLIKTLKKVNEVLDDAKIISGVAAEKTELVSEAVDDTVSAVNDVVATIKGNTTLLSRIKDIGVGAASLKNVVDSIRTSEEQEIIDKRKKEKKENSK